uniref:Anaphase-promoting complex subunit 4-like WD40 domain-containing protein n=1 Tax=Meloidogyne javanica TaxID=6303 RepID=A0A915MSG4_MELJA
MFIYMPCIFWHDRKGILFIDVLQNSTTRTAEDVVPIYKIVTASIQKEIRVWNFRFDPIEISVPKKQQIEESKKEEENKQQQNEDSISHLETSLVGRTGIEISLTSTILSGNFIASGDADGYLIVWNLVQSCLEENEKNEISNEKQLKELQLNNNNLEDNKNNEEIPPNRENWQRSKARFSPHPGEITALCFSPDSQFIASVSMNNSISVNRTENGKRLWERGAYRHFANGIIWDPRGKYLVTMSTDRRLDILDAFKGTILRSCCQIELPMILIPEINQQAYKIFHDDQLHAFQRGVEFSPCGGVLFAPAALLEVGTNNIYGTFAFFRNDLKFCRPNALFPSAKPTIQVKCSPLIYKLDEGTRENFLGLPHRLIFAVLCWDSILLYNSQNETPFAYFANLHYDGLTSIAWTPDGRFLVVSSLEGFNSFICMDTKKMGIPIELKEVLQVEKVQQGSFNFE